MAGIAGLKPIYQHPTNFVIQSLMRNSPPKPDIGENLFWDFCPAAENAGGVEGQPWGMGWGLSGSEAAVGGLPRPLRYR